MGSGAVCDDLFYCIYTAIYTTGTVPTFMRIQWKQRVLCSIRDSEWMPSTNAPMLLADVK